MIQRIQSIYLLIAGFLPSGVWAYYNGTPPSLILVGWSTTILLTYLTIFFYKNRVLQSIISILAAITFIATQLYLSTTHPEILDIRITYGSTVLYLILILLAVRNIRKDEKLVKSTNRLR